MTDDIAPIDLGEPEEPPIETVDGGVLFVLLRQLESFRTQEAWLKDAIKTTSLQIADLTAVPVRFMGLEGELKTARVVRPDGRVKVDLSTLAGVDPEAFSLITKPAVDSAKLRRALKARVLSDAALRTMHVTPQDPHVRLSAESEEQEHGDDD